MTSLCMGAGAGEKPVHEAITVMLRVGEGDDLGDCVNSKGDFFSFPLWFLTTY